MDLDLETFLIALYVIVDDLYQQYGVATEWALASGNVQKRWVAEVLFSSRAGVSRSARPA